MPNPFSPKPGSSWREPSPRSPAPRLPRDRSARLGNALSDEAAWRDTLPTSPQPDDSDPVTWLMIGLAIAGVVVAIASFASLWAEAEAREHAACLAQLASQNVPAETAKRVCGGAR